MKSIKYLVAAIMVMIPGFGADMANSPLVHAEEAGSETSVSCISISRIRNIEVVDDQTILFHMAGNKTWVNRLPFPLHGLKFEGGIHYETSLTRLCDKDIITVIRRPGTTGPLGLFTPYSEDSKEDIGE